MKLKAITLLCFLIFVGNFSFAQSKKELKKHAKAVQESKEEGYKIVSMDTLFIKGKPYCLMKQQETSKLERLTATPSYKAYSFNGHGPVIIKPSNDDASYTFTYDYNNWERKCKMKVTGMRIKNQIIGMVAKSWIFGQEGTEFDPKMLVFNTARTMSLYAQASYMTGVRNSKQDTSLNIRMNTDERKITRGSKVIGTYKTKTNNKGVKYRAIFYPRAKHHPFVVFPKLKEPGKMKFITETDGKEHEVEVTNTKRQIRTVANYLANNGYL